MGPRGVFYTSFQFEPHFNLKKKNKGTIYLSGGGDADVTAGIDTQFLSNIRDKNILYIPIAKSADRNGYKKSYRWLVNKLGRLCDDQLTVTMALDLSVYTSIDKYSAVYIGGGNTYKLMAVMSKSGFSSILKRYIYNGGVVYGASAGAVMMGKDISTFIEDKYILENKKHNFIITKGMSLVGNYSILTHYNDGDSDKLRGDFRSNDNPIIAIPAGVALIVKNKSATVLGNKPVYILKKAARPKRIAPNTEFVL